MKNIFTGLLILAVSFVFGQENSQWRGLNRDGIYHETGLLTVWPEEGPELLWHYDELGDGHGSVAVANSMIYVSGTEGENGFVIAMNDKGDIIWKTGYGKEWTESYEGVRTTPAVYEGKLYIMSGFGLVSCMDAKNGVLLWQVDILKEYGGQNLKWGITENLLIYDDILVCTPGGKENNVIGLDRNTGELVWTCKGKGEISAYGSPALVYHNGRKIVVSHTEKSILGIDGENGTLLWSIDQPNQWSVHANTPLYHEGRLYCVSGYGKGGVMVQLSEDGSAITELWRDEMLDNKLGGFVLLDGKIYGSGDYNKSWYCLDWNTGTVLYTSKELKKGNIIAAEGLLYWYSQSGDVALVSPEADTFKIISSFKVPYGKAQHWAHLVINNKRLFVRHGNSLMVYSLEKKKGVSEWRGVKRTGVFENEKNLLKNWPPEGPELLWYNDSIPMGYASVSVYNGRIYTTGKVGDNDVVVALDNEGTLLWTTAYGRKWDNSYDDSRCTPTVEGDRLYVSSGLGDVACLDAIHGKLLWQVRASELFGGSFGRWGLSESLLIHDDKVFFTPGGNSTTMVALDKNTGNTIWKSISLNDEPSYTSPLMIERNGETIVCNLTQNYFFGLLAETGEMMWKFDFGEYAKGFGKPNNQTNTPLYSNGDFFLTSGYDHQSVLVRLAEDNRSVSLVWVDSLLDVHHGGVVCLDGYIYGSNWESNRKGDWICLKWETGEKMYQVEWETKGSIISADDLLFCYEEKGGTMGIAPVDPENFEVTSSFKIPFGQGPHWAHPVIHEGILYVRHGNAVMAYRIGGG